MAIWGIRIGLIVCAYLLGSVPASYLAGKSQGIDLRQHGTSQVGGGNLWRMTSWRLGLPVGIFDFGKGLGMVWIAQLAGLGIAPQIVVGAAAIAGHNWPVFLRFHGGRGVGTALGVFSILPFINNMTPWVSVVFWGILVVGRLVLGSSPLPVLACIISAPLISWGFHEPLWVNLGFVAIFLVIAIKRLTAQTATEAASISQNRVLLNRLLFDRDIRDRKVWMYRKSITQQDKWED